MKLALGRHNVSKPYKIIDLINTADKDAGSALSSSPARRAPDDAPPEPTWLDLGPCAAGIWHRGSRCAQSISEVLDWVASRTESAALRELVFPKRAAQPNMQNSKVIAAFTATVMQTK